MAPIEILHDVRQMKMGAALLPAIISNHFPGGSSSFMAFSKPGPTVHLAKLELQNSQPLAHAGRRHI
jgi:hypothetical protein